MKDILKRINKLIGPHHTLVESSRTADYVVISVLHQGEILHLYYVFALYQPFSKELSKLFAALVAEGILTEAQVSQFTGL